MPSGAIFGRLAAPRDGPRLVLTHHAPSPQCLAPERRDDLLSGAYASDLEPEIRDASPDVWLYRHTHEPIAIDLAGVRGPVRLRSNPRGYPGERTGFDPLAAITF